MHELMICMVVVVLGQASANYQDFNLLKLQHGKVSHELEIESMKSNSTLGEFIHNAISEQKDTDSMFVKFLESQNFQATKTPKNASNLIFDKFPNYKAFKSETFPYSADSALVKSQQSRDFPCPDQSHISPCICSEEMQGLRLDCTSVVSDDQLVEVFLQDFPAKNFWQFYMGNNTAILYLLDVFNGITFRDIHIDTPNLWHVSDTAFFGSLETLESIFIGDSMLIEKEFPFTDIHRFQKLRSLSIVSSSLVTFPKIDSSSVQSINFGYGFISALPLGES